MIGSCHTIINNDLPFWMIRIIINIQPEYQPFVELWVGKLNIDWFDIIPREQGKVSSFTVQCKEIGE